MATYARLVPTLAVLAACAGPEAEPAPRPSAVAHPTVTVARRLPAGTIVALDRCRVVAGSSESATVADGLLREALRLGTHLDIACGIESTGTRWTLVPALDADAGRLSIALVDGTENRPPVTIAGATTGARPLSDVVDEVAWATRLSLGDPVGGPPPAVAAVYSTSHECVVATERALDDVARGVRGGVAGLVERARRADAGCPITWLAHVTAEFDAGDATGAARRAEQALTILRNRLAPHTRDRLARIMLLARAQSGNAEQAQAADTQLLALGNAVLAERPHDPHGRYSKALALNYLGRFAEAREHLAILRTRWPRVPWVAYHHAFALLATGDPAGALEAIESVQRSLPRQVAVLPTCLAMYHAGQHDELDGYLTRLQQRADDEPATPTAHELRRIRAAHAILRGDRATAARLLLDDIDWLGQRPSLLANRAGDLADAGEVLIELGYTDPLAERLPAIQAVPDMSPSVGHALVYLGGLVFAKRGDERAEIAVRSLESQRQTAWSTVLKAAVHNRRGELLDESRELATAVRITDSALVRASFARALDTLGKHDDARRLLGALDEQLATLRLRGPLLHPLLSPGRALAWLSARRPRGD